MAGCVSFGQTGPVRKQAQDGHLDFYTDPKFCLTCSVRCTDTLGFIHGLDKYKAIMYYTSHRHLPQVLETAEDYWIVSEFVCVCGRGDLNEEWVWV